MYHVVEQFEQQIAEYYGASYAVATDSCTHAIELCWRYDQVDNITIPAYTYISVPMTAMKLNLSWSWNHDAWNKSYMFGNTRIVDGAVNFERGSHQDGTLMCLSFQFQKMLNLVRGGAILCNSVETYKTLKYMSHDGRTDNNIPWAKQDIAHVGYHYYMPPETAELGIKKLQSGDLNKSKTWSDQDYPYLPDFKVFQHVR